MALTVAFYVTGHGFGHATRCCAVMAALRARDPKIRLIVRSPVPAWLLRLNIPGPFAHQAVRIDVGVVQGDVLTVDPLATLEAFAGLWSRHEDLVREEADRLRRAGAGLVVGDIPPLAFLIARAAGIPGVALTNFSWDWIYAPYVRRHPEYAWVPDAIREGYARADLLLRLPLHGDLSIFREIRDIPLVARRATRTPEAVRSALGLPRDRRIVLLSFGGLGLSEIAWGAVARLDRFTFVTTDPPPGPAANLVVVRPARWRDLRYEDLVAASDAVITKPGYGIVADCIASRTPLLYTSRGEFPEYEVLVEGLKRHAVARFIDNADLLAGRWGPPLEELLAADGPWPEVRCDGAAVAAEALLAAAETVAGGRR